MRLLSVGCQRSILHGVPGAGHTGSMVHALDVNPPPEGFGNARVVVIAHCRVRCTTLA